MTNRRTFLTGLIGVTAPAIIPYKSLMPVKLFVGSIDTAYRHYGLQPHDYVTHLIESIRLSKEQIAADFFNSLGVYGNVVASS